MRQLLSSLPPRMVSRKWTFQLSSGHTLPMAAAAPPSAMTVCAFPEEGLAHQRGSAPQLLGLDGGSETGTAGSDHDDVEVMGLDVVMVVWLAPAAQKILGSLKTPLATSRT